jgi:hypothetical protein
VRTYVPITPTPTTLASQTVPPVPEGADFDYLVDEVCTNIRHSFDTHLHSDYQYFKDQHSSILMTGRNRFDRSVGHDGVESWIRRGTLRATEDLNPVLNSFLAEKRQAVRMRKLAPDWQTDHHDFQVLGSKFGLPAPPTREELERQRREERARYEEQSRRNAEAERETGRKRREADEAEVPLRAEALEAVREICRFEWTDEYGNDSVYPFVWKYDDNLKDETYIRDRIAIVMRLMKTTTPTVPGDDIVAFFKENFQPAEDRDESTDEFTRISELFTQQFNEIRETARATAAAAAERAKQETETNPETMEEKQ